jgi:endonuclease/exonuclease/phosphatase family metal-dependent hydrolase
LATIVTDIIAAPPDASNAVKLERAAHAVSNWQPNHVDEAQQIAAIRQAAQSLRGRTPSILRQQSAERVKLVQQSIQNSKAAQTPRPSEVQSLSMLTWNICYQCMQGKPEGTVKRACPKTQVSSIAGPITVCELNIASFINANGPYAVIALQEASEWESLQQLIAPVTQAMRAIAYQPGLEAMVTLYDSGWKLEASIMSYMKDRGRPMMLLFFSNAIIVNLHPGHGRDFYQFSRHLEAALNGKKPGSKFEIPSQQWVNQQLKSLPIVLLGDMNTRPPSGPVTFFTEPFFGNPSGRTFAGFHLIPTCCSAVIQVNRRNASAGAYDQILATLPNAVAGHEVPIELIDASDHLPLKATVYFK